jgi:hypothetical protein
MKQAGTRIKTQAVDRAELVVDLDAFRPIVEDMKKNGGDHVPASGWVTLDSHWACDVSVARPDEVESTFTESGVRDRFSSLEAMLAAWIGTGQEPIVPATLENYRRALATHDPLGLWRANVEDPEVLRTLVTADLGSIMDVDFIHSFMQRQPEVTRVLEVGGGYGRLAEAMLNVFGRSIRYVMVDAVPASLFYAKRYMAKACPQARVGSYYDGDPFDFEKFDCYVMPSWHFEKQNKYRYDACVNVLSFQEMAQQHVDYFLGLFDRVAEEDALIYLANAHDGPFRGTWNFPDTWEKRCCASSPRLLWALDNRIEIFAKRKYDCSLSNGALDAAYRYSVESRFDPQVYFAGAGLRRAVAPIAQEAARRIAQRTTSMGKSLIDRALGRNANGNGAGG